jgi:glycosyltransferase involved in cell wall biosynthesis
MWPMLQRPSLRYTACFHATSAAEADDVLAAGFHAPVAVIPNGIDAPAPGRVLGSRRTLLYLGRIHPIKQVDVLLGAWARLERSSIDWDLRIVGPDNDGCLGEMRRLAGSLGVQRVRFEGELQGDAKLDAYRSADLYVLPTRSENFGMTVAEALVAGTPAVVTDGAPWSGLRSEGAGWWIDQGVDALESALRGAMSTPRSELEAMGTRGRNWMIRDFGWKRIADSMESLYRWILAGSRDDSRPPEISTAPHGRKEKAR